MLDMNTWNPLPVYKLFLLNYLKLHLFTKDY